jgi:hypothetical protein
MQVFYTLKKEFTEAVWNNDFTSSAMKEVTQALEKNDASALGRQVAGQGQPLEKKLIVFTADVAKENEKKLIQDLEACSAVRYVGLKAPTA